MTAPTTDQIVGGIINAAERLRKSGQTILEIYIGCDPRWHVTNEFHRGEIDPSPESMAAIAILPARQPGGPTRHIPLGRRIATGIKPLASQENMSTFNDRCRLVEDALIARGFQVAE